jgi:hypothetical protein
MTTLMMTLAFRKNRRLDDGLKPSRVRWPPRIIATIALAASIPLIAAHAQTPASGLADEPPAESARAKCADRLTRFILEMDEILTKDPPSVQPLLDLRQKYFPLEGCDLEESMKICRGSKYLVGIERARDFDLFVFNSSKFWNRHSGFMFQFGLRKPSGDSELPFAQVNK